MGDPRTAEDRRLQGVPGSARVPGTADPGTMCGTRTSTIHPFSPLQFICVE